MYHDKEDHFFPRYISSCILFLANLSFNLPVSDQARTEKRARLVFLFAEDACALLVLIKLGEHSQSGSTHRVGQIRESEIRLQYCSYRCWIATEHPLPDQPILRARPSPRVPFVSPRPCLNSRNIEASEAANGRTKIWRHVLLPPAHSREQNVTVRSFRANGWHKLHVVCR